MSEATSIIAIQGDIARIAPLVPANGITYATFKQAALTLHEQGKEGAQDGDFWVLARGLQLLNELSVIFPTYATRLADDPEFLS
jgi:hypothetical protein